MKIPFFIFPLLALASCVGPQSVRVPPDLIWNIDRLCQWTGMRRVGAIRSVERWHTQNPGYNIALDIAADSVHRRYLIRFDADRRLLSFKPAHFNLGGIAQGLGFDSIQDPRMRAVCVAAVKKLNSQLKWTYVGRPAIQKVGPNYLVTYQTVSEAEQEKSGYRYLDPYVSFLVTPRGTVIATFWGA